jgi:hypothetical protein
LAEEAIIDLMNMLLDYNNLYIIGMDINIDKIEDKNKRENRDISFLEKERNVLEYANIIFTNYDEDDDFVTTDKVIQILKDIKFIE